MAKKSKVDKSRERKKEIGAKKTNPFEVTIIKSHLGDSFYNLFPFS